jgi:protein-disulfide isomerase
MNKLSIQIIAFICFIAIATAALYYGGVFGNSNDQSSSSDIERTARNVHILKYSDYSCPACKLYTAAQEQLKAEFGDLVEIEYRYFPLESFPHSMLAAQSVEAAKMQGKFQEMHDLVFEYQAEWSPRQADAMGYFTRFAEQIGLNMDQFTSDINSDQVRNVIINQRQEGIRRTVNATPTYFIDGHKIRQLPQSYDQFKAIVELYMYRSN